MSGELTEDRGEIWLIKRHTDTDSLEVSIVFQLDMVKNVTRVDKEANIH